MNEKKLMNAWVLHDVNSFTYEDRVKPEPDAGWVLVRVKAAGICGSDIPRAFTTGAHKKDLVIGHEFSGCVEAVGADVDVDWIGKKVGIFPLIPCRKCGPCSQGRYEMCRNYNYLGSRCDGGFADYVAAPVANLIEIPENVTYEQAAMLEPMAVAVHAMRRGLELIGESRDGAVSNADMKIAVCGLGTIGLLLVMFLRQKGFRNIYVIGNKASQKKHIDTLGISEEYFCDSREHNITEWLAEHAGGVDMFYECVGKNETVACAVDSLNPAGALVLVGNPYSDMSLEKAVYWKILRNQLKLTGTWNSSFTGDKDDDWHYVINCLEQGLVAPEKMISHRYEMKELMQGFLIMRDKTEDYVKIMGVND